jgi:hypothetical protein
MCQDTRYVTFPQHNVHAYPRGAKRQAYTLLLPVRQNVRSPVEKHGNADKYMEVNAEGSDYKSSRYETVQHKNNRNFCATLLPRNLQPTTTTSSV